MTAAAFLERTESTTTVERPIDPRRTTYSAIDLDKVRFFNVERSRSEFPGRVALPDLTSISDQVLPFDWTTFQITHVNTYALGSRSLSTDTDAFTKVSQGASILQYVGIRAASANFGSQTTRPIGEALAESLSALSDARDSVSTWLAAWSDLQISALAAVTGALEACNPMALAVGKYSFSQATNLDSTGNLVQEGLRKELERLRGFARLESDWDSYGAKKTTSGAIEAASQYLASLVNEYRSTSGIRALPFWVSPLPNGGVQFEWREPNAELEVEIDRDGNLSYLLQTGQGQAADFLEREAASLTEVSEVLGRVLAA